MSEKNETILSGISGKRILCLANLRLQKNQFLLIDIAEKLLETNPQWTFHLVGKDFNDNYSKKLRETIKQKKLEANVFIYGSKNDTTNIINQATICVFTSSSEGLPVALLEFGLLSKPVISTQVGEIPLIIKNEYNGLLVPVNDIDKFIHALLMLIENPNKSSLLGINLKKTVEDNNSEVAVISNYINWLKSL